MEYLEEVRNRVEQKSPSLFLETMQKILDTPRDNLRDRSELTLAIQEGARCLELNDEGYLAAERARRHTSTKLPCAAHGGAVANYPPPVTSGEHGA